jgi:hypothetical protein
MANISPNAQRILDLFESKDLNAIADHIADDALIEGQPRKTGLITLLEAEFAAFPDLQFNFRDAHEEGDTVYVTYEMSGTHTGRLDYTPLGLDIVVPPTNKPIKLPPAPLEFSLADETVIEIDFRQTDDAQMAALLEQLA